MGGGAAFSGGCCGDYGVAMVASWLPPTVTPRNRGRGVPEPPGSDKEGHIDTP